jgi:glutathione S-transferase
MSKTTLTYFDIPTSRGEECRLALHLAGIPFTDERLNREQFAARKAATPFGSLPILTVEGHPPLAQSNTILRMIGREHGMHPTDPWAAAREESIMEAIEDCRWTMQAITRMKDPAEKKKAREEAASGYLQEWAGHLERQIEGPFVNGSQLHVVDLKIFVMLGSYLKGAIDHIPSDVFQNFPKLLGVSDAVKSHPKIKEWYAR